MLIGLVAKTITMKTVAVEGLIVEAIDVNGDDMHRKMALIKQGTIIL